jgi:hypothetical protein
VPPREPPGEVTVSFVTRITDAPTHDGPGGAFPYEGVAPRPHELEETMRALDHIGAEVLGLYRGLGEETSSRDDAAHHRDRRRGGPLARRVRLRLVGVARGPLGYHRAR